MVCGLIAERRLRLLALCFAWASISTYGLPRLRTPTESGMQSRGGGRLKVSSPPTHPICSSEGVILPVRHSRTRRRRKGVHFPTAAAEAAGAELPAKRRRVPARKWWEPPSLADVVGGAGSAAGAGDAADAEDQDSDLFD